MQLENNAILIICLVVFLGLALPVGMYMGMRGRRGTVGQIELFRKAAGSARHPWEGEDKDLEELSNRVGKLHENKDW